MDKQMPPTAHAGHASTKAVDPLAPIAFITNVLLTLLLLGLLVAGTAAATGSGELLSFGSDADVCVTAPVGSGLTYEFRDGPRSEGVVGVHPGITSRTREIETCDTQPSLGLRMLGSVPGAFELVFFFGFLLFIRSLIRHARHHGLFTPSLARRITILGAYVLAGTLLTSVASAIADGMLLRHARSGAPWGWGFTDFSVSIPTLIAGFGILSVGRVLTIAVGMQHEIDATI